MNIPFNKKQKKNTLLRDQTHSLNELGIYSNFTREEKIKNFSETS